VFGSQPVRRPAGPRAACCAVPSVTASGRSDRRRRYIHVSTPPDASVLLASPGQLLSPRRCGLPVRRTGWLPFGYVLRSWIKSGNTLPNWLTGQDSPRWQLGLAGHFSEDNSGVVKQTGGFPGWASAALNAERKAGFGRMDADEKCSRGRTPRLR